MVAAVETIQPPAPGARIASTSAQSDAWTNLLDRHGTDQLSAKFMAGAGHSDSKCTKQCGPADPAITVAIANGKPLFEQLPTGDFKRVLVAQVQPPTSEIALAASCSGMTRLMSIAVELVYHRHRMPEIFQTCL